MNCVNPSVLQCDICDCKELINFLGHDTSRLRPYTGYFYRIWYDQGAKMLTYKNEVLPLQEILCKDHGAGKNLTYVICIIFSLMARMMEPSTNGTGYRQRGFDVMIWFSIQDSAVFQNGQKCFSRCVPSVLINFWYVSPVTAIAFFCISSSAGVWFALSFYITLFTSLSYLTSTFPVGLFHFIQSLLLGPPFYFIFPSPRSFALFCLAWYCLHCPSQFRFIRHCTVNMIPNICHYLLPFLPSFLWWSCSSKRKVCCNTIWLRLSFH